MMYGRLRSFKNRLDVYIRFNRYRRKFAEDLSFTGAATRFPVRDELHAYMHHYFRHLAPQEIRDHRAYYRKEMRGFGEAALHAMWFTLLREFKPAQCLEIGVYRGQVVTLWGIIARQRGFPCELHGISPFSPAGDDVSAYLANLDYEQDVLASCARFGLPDPTFVKGFSTEPAALEHIASRAWDLIYVDGNHDYEVVIADYQACRDALRPGGILIMDDSSVGTDFHPPSFSFAGHPGPSRVVQEYAMKEMRFLGGVAHNNVFQKP